ncbi:MAG TPA: Gfo/Idh/MocA family oxidoreductase [Verrucomicrobiae bacterium]|nr:Gfo/Idh/MocA family oxidoreductase [Verrucomicrobiae bacterium]
MTGAATATSAPARRSRASRLPRLGFLGVGWIGRNRLDAIARAGLAEVVAVADAAEPLAREAGKIAPSAAICRSLDDLLEQELDGIVIATPSALHAEQALAALERGLAVFCQKPLGRNAAETAAVIAAARKADRLLGVDLSYRFMTCSRYIRQLCEQGELGEIYAADLFFHNAYGPDKPWFYDPKLSGGGCVIDLGIHLMDLALWSLGFPKVDHVSSRLFSKGKPVHADESTVEDYAVATLDLDNGATVRLACSWKLPAGCDAVISASFYGTKAGAGFRNMDGSFYHFAAERFQGTRRETLNCAQEDWGGRAAADWARKLNEGNNYDSEIETLNTVAEALDAIYQNA